MSRLPDQNAHSRQRLEKIARAIGVPVSSFYHKGTNSAVSGFPILTYLYSAITDAEGRQRVMDVARQEVERCQRANV